MTFVEPAKYLAPVAHLWTSAAPDFSSVTFKELENDVLLLGSSFVAFVGFGEEHLKVASLLVLAHYLAFDDLEGFFFAIDFGENEFSCLVNVNADFGAHVLLI